MKKTIIYGLCMLLLIGVVQAPPEPFNLTEMGNSSGIVGLTQKVNTILMGGYFGILMLITLFAITFMGFMATTGHAGKSATASSFIMFALSIMLRILGLVSDMVMYAALAFTALCVAFLVGRE